MRQMGDLAIIYMQSEFLAGRVVAEHIASADLLLRLVTFAVLSNTGLLTEY